MVELYLPNGPEDGRVPHVLTRPDDPSFIVAANIAAGWLLDIAGPFFWAALIMIFVLAEIVPRA
jgi:hypothetical protein